MHTRPADPAPAGYRRLMTAEELARCAAARKTQEHLSRQLRDTAARIAETEERGAELYDELAATHPDRATRLQRMAQGAREFADHERRQARGDRPDPTQVPGRSHRRHPR